MRTAEELLSLSSDELKRRHAKRGKRRGPYNREPRPSFSREELSAYLRENEIKSIRTLRKTRDGSDPSEYDYVKEFGSWKAAKLYVWKEFEAPVDRRYLVQSIIEFGLWTYRDYCSARRRRPDVFPSVHVIRKEFGGWEILKELAQAFSLRETMAAYAELKTRLGKRPTVSDCHRAKLNLDKAMKMFGSKSKFDQFIDSMEEIS